LHEFKPTRFSAFEFPSSWPAPLFFLKATPLCVTNGNISDVKKGTRGKMIDGQWRAARALIGWSQTALAERIGVSVLTIKRMEGSAGNVSEDVQRRAREALETGGIEFLNRGRPGVRLRARGGV
jgi:DNA-binding XRE family transcriptional regulator